MRASPPTVTSAPADGIRKCLTLKGQSGNPGPCPLLCHFVQSAKLDKNSMNTQGNACAWPLRRRNRWSRLQSGRRQVRRQCRSRAVKHRRLSALRQASVSGVARTAEPCGASRMTVTCAPDTLPRPERNPGSRGAGRPGGVDPVQRKCRGFVRRIEGIRKRMLAFEDEAVARILAPHDRERCRPASLGGTGLSRDPVDARMRQAVLQGDAAQALAGNHRRDNLSVALRTGSGASKPRLESETPAHDRPG